MPNNLRDKDKDKGDTAATRPSITRRRNGSLTTPDEFQDIKNLQEGRKFLEKHSLLCPPGEPASHESLSTCLHQVAAMAGMPKQAINAVRATAFLLEELEENATNETVKNAFDSQTTEFTSDMKILVEYAKTKIDILLQEAIDKIKQTFITEQTLHAAYNRVPAKATATYASTLINPPSYVNPRIAAREGVKARQFLIEGAMASKFSRGHTKNLKADINTAAREAGLKEGNICTAITQRDGSTLIEVDSDATVEWFTDVVNRVELCSLLGERVTFRPRTFNVMAFNAPLNVDTDDQNHLVEILEVNELEDNTILAMRWAKPINRRSKHQKSAHLILSYTNAVAANRAISNGITICHKRCYVERIKKEPIRCLKCQGWNHMADMCEQTPDTCSNCAEPHRTMKCPCPHKKWCVSCKSKDHASWSRECPVFLKKVAAYDERNPENALPFFPTADPWTWSAGVAKTTKIIPPITNRYSLYRGSNERLDNQQYATRPQERARGTDTYIPHYGSQPESRNYNYNPPHDTEGWGEEAPRPTTSSQRTAPPKLKGKVTFVNNSDNAGPSNTNPNSNSNSNPNNTATNA